MMNYQEMSDRSIDLAVFQAIFGKDVLTKDADLRRKWERGISYCNSWADAGKLAEECKIALAPYKKGDGYIWQSFGPGEENYAQTYDRNPCRAICIVFLMMKGGE